MGNTVDGLVSGMDTTAMITSMMSIEAQPQNMLKNKVATFQTAIASYQSVNTKVAALKSSADDLSQLSTWRSISPTVSSTSVSATATGGTNTATGTLTFDVTSVAQVQTNSVRVASSGGVTLSDSLQIAVGAGAPVSIDIHADRSAAGIASAVNNAGLGVKASVVKTSLGDSMVQFNSTKTGAANGFTLTGLEDAGTMHTIVATDAAIQVGGADVDGGFSLTSDTNTFTTLMPGVTMTVSKLENGITLTSAPDVSGIANKIQAMVDAANATLTEVSNQTAYDPGTNSSSPLTGDFMVRQLSQSILGNISSGLTYKDANDNDVKFGSLAKFGVQLDKTGQLKFNAATFTAAYNADPTGIKAAGVGFADSIYALTTKQGTNVNNAITSNKNQVDSLNDQISNWDVRLASKQQALTKQYSDLETALGKLKDQSSWLSGQISSLS